MSQHCFNTRYQDKDVTVLAGWDSPMQQFFLVIEDLNPLIDASDEEVYIYSNLFDENAARQEFSYFENKLVEFGISIPQAMKLQILSDRDLNMGNSHCVYELDGSFTCDGIVHKAAQSFSLEKQ
jgi:hypothetical protein